ncbi:TetR/AcrR family transcriptional regulator [Actinoplanes aureus]|uniref:TetR family transcriptional regulator n=1 Tax=Actinoplanes aureus TaxID=2792083 RepID=A0A931CAU4_9ACTN|nr:TetR/AcrR family transcriptional regulator [Actinoplanes aureus]MBG0563992.1 TetR family transcriptional regulator [Actinoplanes aureus]
MPNTPRAARDARPLTFTEQARRAQFVGLTIRVIAEHGYAGCSLQRIADAAGVTKAAVLYHFASKAALVRAAYEEVIGQLTADVGALVEQAAGPAQAVEAYVRGLTGHLAAHPDHVRVIVEALDGDTAITDRPASPSRWQALAALIEAAKESGAYRRDIDSRVLAIVLGGAIDGLIAESLQDTAFDVVAAADALVDLLRRSTG